MSKINRRKIARVLIILGLIMLPADEFYAHFFLQIPARTDASIWEIALPAQTPVGFILAALPFPLILSGLALLRTTSWPEEETDDEADDDSAANTNEESDDLS